MSAWVGVITAWSLVLVLVAGFSCLRARRRARRFQDAKFTKSEDPILLIRPCAGGEKNLFTTLSSSLRLRSSSPLSIRFAVENRLDGAFSVLSDVTEHAKEHDVKIVITGASLPNRKADQVARVIEAERNEVAIVVVADSDVDLTDFDLDKFLSPLHENAGAVWAMPIETEAKTSADQMSSVFLDGSLHSFSLLAELDPFGMVGKLFALRMESLKAIGGMNRLTHCLGEDMELARLLRSHGIAIVSVPMPARSLAAGRTFAQVVERYARWITVIKMQRPLLLLSYPFFFLWTPIAWVLLGTIILVGQKSAWLALLIVSISRLIIAGLARVGSRQRLSVSLAYAPLSDVVLSFSFFQAITRRRFTWRGLPLRSSKGFLIADVSERAAVSPRRVPSTPNRK